MSRINYSRNMARTDCNYSFCEDKENLHPNPIEDITRILNRHYQLHLKNAHTIRQQAAQIQRMQTAILSIEGKLSLGRPQKSISSISKRESHCQQSIESFPSHPGKQRSGSASSKQPSIKTASITKKSKIISISSHSNCSSQSSPGNNSKLLSSIVQRKLNIERELKERLSRHMQTGKPTMNAMKQSMNALKTVNYITYASER